MTATAAVQAYEKPLSAVMEAFREREMLFVEPGGNWGDDLIYLGAYALARRLGVRWRRLTHDEFLAAPVVPEIPVYVHGGGGFNFFCSGKAPSAFFHAIRRYRSAVVLGPTTVDDAQDYVESTLLPGLEHRAASSIVMFAREATTLGALRGRLPEDIALHLDDDTALQLSAGEALESRPMESRYVLLAMREDNEAPLHGPRPGMAGVRLDPAYYARSFDHWLRIHALASRIVTNRTHSAIIGAVLNKPTVMFGGAYHKNRSIWEYSLRRRGIEWLEAAATAANADPVDRRWTEMPVIGRVARSYKVQRTLKLLRGVPWE